MCVSVCVYVYVCVYVCVCVCIYIYIYIHIDVSQLSQNILRRTKTTSLAAANEHCIPAKKNCIASKEPYTPAKEPYFPYFRNISKTNAVSLADTDEHVFVSGSMATQRIVLFV